MNRNKVNSQIKFINKLKKLKKFMVNFLMKKIIQKEIPKLQMIIKDRNNIMMMRSKIKNNKMKS